MKINILIPARKGSKRVKNKNIRELDGMPLLAYTVITASLLENIDNVIISSDSFDYLALAAKYNEEIIARVRPDELATDTATDKGVILDVLNLHPCDLLVYLRPTTPIRSLGLCQQAIEMMRSASTVTGLRSVEEMPESAYKCFEMNMGFLTPLKGIDLLTTDAPNQAVEKTYKPNGYIDIVHTEQIHSRQYLWGESVIGYVTPKTVEIDTEQDFAYAEWLLKNKGYREEVRFS